MISQKKVRNSSFDDCKVLTEFTCDLNLKFTKNISSGAWKILKTAQNKKPLRWKIDRSIVECQMIWNGVQIGSVLSD